MAIVARAAGPYFALAHGRPLYSRAVQFSSSWSFRSCERPHHARRSRLWTLQRPSLRSPANTAVGVLFPSLLLVMLVLVRPQHPRQLHPSSHPHPRPRPRITIAIPFDHHGGYADLRSSGGRAAHHNSGTPTHLHPLFTSLAPSQNLSVRLTHPLSRRPLVLPSNHNPTLNSPIPHASRTPLFPALVHFPRRPHIHTASTETLSYLTTCASADEPPPDVPGVSGLGLHPQANEQTSAAPSLHGFSIYRPTSPCLRG